MTHSFFPYTTLAGVGCVLLLGACGGGGGSSSTLDDDTGTLSLAITDAPVDTVAEVVVQFTGVRIQPASGAAIDFEFDEPRNIDLLTLTGEESVQLLDGETVPAGEYEWILLQVNAEFDSTLDSYVQPAEGGQVELRVPSGGEQGLRLVSGFTITASQASSFIIDWDLRKGLTDPVGQEGYFLRPALRITDMTQHGTISGTVADALVNAGHCNNSLAEETGNLVYVYQGADVTPADVDGTDTDPLTTARVAMDDQAAGAYTYSVAFLSPGEYTVAFTCQGLSDNPEAVDDLTFIQPQTTTVAHDEDSKVNFDPEEPEA